MSAAQMPLYDPEDPRWDAWRRSQRRSEAEAEFNRRYWRRGERSILARYIVAPMGRLAYGWTAGDTIVLLAVLAFALLLGMAFGIGWDGYFDAVGY